MNREIALVRATRGCIGIRREEGGGRTSLAGDCDRTRVKLACESCDVKRGKKERQKSKIKEIAIFPLKMKRETDEIFRNPIYITKDH